MRLTLAAAALVAASGVAMAQGTATTGSHGHRHAKHDTGRTPMPSTPAHDRHRAGHQRDGHPATTRPRRPAARKRLAPR